MLKEDGKHLNYLEIDRLIVTNDKICELDPKHCYHKDIKSGDVCPKEN